MLENEIKVGAPSWLPTAEAGAVGTGGLCSHGVLTGILNGHHRYLPFARNGINWVASQGEDVISYNFTGCIMAAFTYQGSTRVCHVSTGAGQDCKAAWDTIKGQSTNVFEFRPSDFTDPKGGALAGCYGLITSDLQTYAITTVRPANGAGVKIASVVKARLLR